MIYLISGLFCFLLTLLSFSSEARFNTLDSMLEQSLSNHCIVNTQQITIPGYPSAYNPSLIPYKDGYLLSFRYRSKCPEQFKNDFRVDASFIGVVRLNRDFKVSEKTIQLLNIMSYSPQFSLTAEDARFLNVGNRIFIFFNDLPLLGTSGKFAMYVAELIEEQGIFVLKTPAKHLDYSYAIRVEKNWSPFSWGDKLYVIYSAQPWVILEVDVNTGYCQEITRTVCNWNWNLGEIRGGTPACLVNDVFLSFFHSCFPANNSKGKVYIMGAYTFDKEFPFSVRTITPHPLGDLTYYLQNNSSKVVFPGGIVLQDHLIHVAWGKADKQIWITTFDKEQLFDSMKPYSE